MTSQIPAPGSVWFHIPSSRPMRVAPAGNSELDITAMDCEYTAEMPNDYDMMSWRGTADQFDREFEPFPSELYPRTA